MRARHPDVEGHVDCDGVSIGYEVFGHGEPAILFMPTWTIVHARIWKLQVPYLARHFRVVTFDGPGNGRSDRPTEPVHYSKDRIVTDAIAVLDATKTERAVVVSLSRGASWALTLAADYPDRVMGQVFIGPGLPLTPPLPEHENLRETFHSKLDDPQGWEKYNLHHWLSSYQDFLEFFFAECLTEPHSTKQIEDGIGWASETTPEILVTAAQAKFGITDRETVLALCDRISSPTLIFQGLGDHTLAPDRGRALAEVVNGRLVEIEGGGHFPMARDPVLVNLHIKAFVDSIVGTVAA
jgi:pimeloyl-ACP methyl ester carboxylesterase